MGEKIRNEELSIRERMLKLYDIEESSKGLFFLQVDWLLENAVFPLENGYAENLIDLWNVYMPKYKFDKIVLEYSKKYFPVLRYVHDGEVFNFNSVKYMQECTIKNFVKYCISQGETSRMSLVKECFDLLKEVSNRTKLYDSINYAIEGYFQNGDIEQYGVMFLRRFQDYTEQPYTDILARLNDIHEQREMFFGARSRLYEELKSTTVSETDFQTLINIVLCKLAAADGEQKFSDELKGVWESTVPQVAYDEKIYSFIEKYEKPYMNAACFGIKNIKDGKVVRQLYKDVVILCAVLDAVEKGNRYGLREVNDFWKKDGMRFANGYFFDDEYARMQAGFAPEILIQYKSDIELFHTLLIEKIEAADFSSRNSGNRRRGRRDASSEMNHVALNERNRQIEDLQERVSELEEKVDNTEKDVLSQFISLLDSKKYDHVLGKLYRIAYSGDELKIEDIQRILKNLFEIMNISGIDIYGEIGTTVQQDDTKRGKYRIDKEINGKAVVKYPGYRVGNFVILHPLAEEV